MKKQLIYAVEDDEGIQEVYQGMFEDDYDIKIFGDSATFFQAMNIKQPVLVILDVMLPDMDGFTILSELRKKDKTLPVIIVSAKDDEISLIRGLNKGADDYISKPFSLYELSARVKRNISRYTVFSDECGDFTIDETKMRAYYKSEIISLTLKEYELLRAFLSSPYKMLSRDELFNEVWGYDYAGESRTIDMHVASLREKLKKMGAENNIETVRGVGYRFTP